MKTSFLKQLFCRHKNLRFTRNIHGDEILLRDWNRSEWICEKCLAYVYKPDLKESHDKTAIILGRKNADGTLVIDHVIYP